ncbi:MAG: gliding motility-associated C-terminal domain-containing protein [Bacteroidetes bacterium]|nr:gliding motility-associated C-terminal domain-containing protein [Bacteroidota bacterium]
MKNYLIVALMAFATLGLTDAKAQVSGTINLGPDFIIPVCQPCTTLVAATTPASGGTSNYNVNQIAYNPYPYVPGTIINLAVDDLWSGIIPIPFDFCYFDSTYNQCIVSSNGQVSFNIGQAGAYNPWSFAGVTPMPNAVFTAAHNSIMSPYHDILPTGLGMISYQTIGVAPNRVFVVSWNNSPMFSCVNLLATQQIALYEGSKNWYDASGNLLATNVDSLQVCPSQTTTYNAKATFTLCGGFEYAFDTITVTKQDSIKLTVTSVTDVNCFGGADGGFSYSQTGGTAPFTYTLNGNAIAGSPVSNLVAGIYTIVASDANNCTQSLEVTVNEPAEVQLTIDEQRDVLCKYQNNGYVRLLTVGGVPAYSYWYDNTPPVLDPEFKYMKSGNFRFYTSDSHGCLDSIDTYIAQPDSLLTVSLISHIATCKNGNDGSVDAITSGGVPPYTYEWNTTPPQYGATATGLKSDVYHVVATDYNGCITATQVAVDLELSCNIFMPTAFTPNGDTRNDIYRILEHCGGVILGEFKIYNRWGVEVYSTRELTGGWDGTYKGKAQDPDTYSYLIIYQCNDKGIISQKVAKGDFILVR